MSPHVNYIYIFGLWKNLLYIIIYKTCRTWNCIGVKEF